MNILSLDTSFKTASVCVIKNGEVTELKDSAPLQHSTVLLPLCLKTLRKAGLELKDIDVFAASSGPGSFTGIRIGISAVKGFAFSLDKPCAGISSLESAARMAPEGCKKIMALIRAREGEYYCALFSSEGGFKRLSEDKVMPKKELDLSGAFLCGDGALDFVSDAPLQCAQGCARAVLCDPDRASSCHDLVPVYLKPSQAERIKKKEVSV